MDEIFVVTSDYDISDRADIFLSKIYSEYSRSYFTNAINDNRILVNDKTIKPSYKFKIGDEISIDFSLAELLEIVGEDIHLDIIYEDDDILVINKDKNMVVHPAPGHTKGTIVNGIINHCKNNLSGINGKIRPGIVHRIDKDTSGVLLICKNDYSHNIISNQFKEHTVFKKYICITHGNFDNDNFIINRPIGRDKKDRKKMAIVDGGREAITEFKVIKQYKQYSILECILKTGRTHQIRVHLASIHRPIICDNIYGKVDKEFHIDGQCLHASTLGIIHPRTNEYIEFTAPLPEYFQNAINYLDKNYV